MREYIKKFDTPSLADGYSINDIPFIATIASTGQNLYCNEEDKMIVIDEQGNASIEDVGPSTITIHYEWGYLHGRWDRPFGPEDITPSLQEDKIVTAPYILTYSDFVNYVANDGESCNQQDIPYIISPTNDEQTVIAEVYWDDYSVDNIHFYSKSQDDDYGSSFEVNQDITIFVNLTEWCLTKDTLITLSNGSNKLIQDITYDDVLQVWNFDEGYISESTPLWIMIPRKTKGYWKCKFENGLELNLIGSNGKSHRVFNYTDQIFEYPQDCIGKEVYTEKGITKLISCEYVNEETEYYNIITNQHINLFANDILTSCRYNNIYPIKNMKFVKDDRNIIPYEEYKNSIPYDYYIGMRLGEQPIGIDNNIRYVKKLLLTQNNVH